MIYGYASKTVSDAGLQQMREICFSTDPENLRQVAQHLLESADALGKATRSNWHRHVSVELANRLGCDVIVALPKENDSTSTQ